MKPTYKELQQKISDLEEALANCSKEQVKISNLEDQHRVFEAIISQSPSAILITNEQGIIGYVNSAFHQTLGYLPEEMKEEFMLSILQGEESIAKYEELKVAIQNGEIYRGDLRTARKDKRIIWIRLTIFPLVYQGKLTNYVAIFNDITSLKVIEAEKRERENVYRTLIENIPLAIAIYDGKGRFIYANEKTEELFHLEKGSITGKTFHQVFPKETADDQMKVMYQIFKTGRSVTSERNISWNGQTFNINVIRQPLFNENGEVTSVLAIGQDIAAHKRQMHLLNIQQEIDSLSNVSANLQSSLKMVFYNLTRIDWIDGGGIYLFDDDFKTLRLVSSTGLSREYTRKVSVYSANELPAKVVRLGKARYASAEDFLEPTRDILTKEGITFTVSIPLIHEKKVLGSLNLGSRSVDRISESDRLIIESIANRLANLISLVKTREQLFSSNRKLNKSLLEIGEQQQLLIQKSRLESLGELSAGLAHEINQPLSVISLVMENINYKMEQKAATEEYLISKFSAVSHNINKIRELVDHVRIFSRDQGNIMFERVDVNQVIFNALSMIESQLKSYQIKIIIDLANDIGYTIGNPSRFEQVILNLLSNARDALVEKEKKTMTGIQSKEIRISTSKEKDQIFVKVWDNGTGISSANLDKIFNPFFTTKTEGRGTGLGLPIVYGIITEMKGKISARSIEDEFTEINITLPFYKKMLKKNDNL